MATKSEFMVDWTCSLCTMINKAKDYACNICGARKGSSTRRGRGRAQQLDEIVAQQMQGEMENLKTDKSDTESSRPDTPVNLKVPAVKPVKSGKNSTTSSPSVNKSPKVKPMKTKTIKTTSKIQKANKIVKTQEKTKRRLPPKHANLDIMSAQSISITANGVTVQFNRFVESIGASNIKIVSDVISNNNNIEENKTEKTSEKIPEKTSEKSSDKKKIDKHASEKNSSKKPESKQEPKNSEQKQNEKLDDTKQSDDKMSETAKPETVKNPEPSKKPENAAQKPQAVKNQDPSKKPEMKKSEVKKPEAKKPEAKKPETKKKDTKKPEITEKPEVIKKLETTKNPESPKKPELTKKDSKKPSSAKTSTTNTPTKKRGIDSDTRLVRTGSGSSNRTASSNERSPRPGSDVKGVKRSRR